MRLLILLVATLAGVLLNICTGDVSIPPEDALQAIFWHSPDAAYTSTAATIIWQIRLPRLLVAAAVGATLAVSGYLLQALSRNDLADPYLTGVSSGAAVAVALALAFGAGFQVIAPVAFIGGLLSSLVVATLSRSGSGLSVTRLLLSGVAVSTICSGLITLIITRGGDPLRAQGIFFWLAGGISGRGWQDFQVVSIYAIVGCILALVLSKQVRLLALGPQQARALGVDVVKTQWALLSVAVLLCGAAVSVSGMVGFVGLVAPHLARRIFGRDERIHIVCTALVGALLVLISDLAARTLGQGQELPLGTLLSLVGGPFFLFLVARQKGEELA